MNAEAVNGPARILGICGAPCTGKTTLALWLHRKLRALDMDCELLPELARLLAAGGVAIDREMHEPDYAAFLAAYGARDTAATAIIAIADRTPIDHCSYLLANRNMAESFVNHHRQVALATMARYRLLVYLPIQFPIQADGFRETSPLYQQELDQAISGLLRQVAAPVVTIRAQRRKRQRLLLAEVRTWWPELFSQPAAAGFAG